MGRWELIGIACEQLAAESEEVMSDRVSWQCPECGRSFRIPASKPRPAWCPDCAAAMDSDGDIDFDIPSPAPKSKFNPSVTVKKTGDAKKTNQPARSESREPSRGTPVPSPFASSPAKPPQPKWADDDDHDAKQQQILDELAKISQTMKLFRRLVWGMAIAMILNVVLMGVGLVYSLSMIGSIGSLFGGDGGVVNPDGANLDGANVDPANVNLEGLPPKLQNDLKKIQEYQQTVNELLEEGR